jgi:hypothetical protein
MFKSKNVFYLFILTIVCAGIVIALLISMDNKKPQALANKEMMALTSSTQVSVKSVDLPEQEVDQVKKLPMQFCPKSEDLFKQEVYWATKDDKWKSYTSSSADKVINFIGAQWAGIRVGKIICLYQTNEAVAFPLAIERVMSQGVSEPSGLGWSAEANNFRLCKSASIADCGFYYEPPRDTSNIYNEIKYNPKADDFN